MREGFVANDDSNASLHEQSPLPRDVVTLLDETLPSQLKFRDENFAARLLELRGKLPEGAFLILMRTSIRGRMALGITCFENYLVSIDLHRALAKLIDRLWYFVEVAEGPKWESYPLLDSVRASSNTEGSDWPEIPQVGEKMAELVLDIGVAHVGPAMPEFDLDSFWQTLLVLELAHDARIPIPDLAHFERSAFHECGGWGNPVSRAFFKE